MSQADGNVANASGAVFRADLNNQLAALWTQHSGNAAPSPTYAFQPWVDTGVSPPMWRIRNASNNGWITIGALDGTFGVSGVTAIANGGTGQTTASNAINALVPSQTGNSGNFLTTNGTSVSWGAVGSSPTVEIFTSSTTWTCPSGVTEAIVTVVGGGGGGGGSGSSTTSGGAGGNGGVGVGVLSLTPATVYTITIGAGGNGSNTTTGAAGGTSSFLPQGGSTLIAATGGAGGSYNNSVAGSDGSCSSTDANMRRSHVSIVSVPYLDGGIKRQGSGTTAEVWSITSDYGSGKYGQGESNNTGNAAGGVGGAIVIQYWN